MRFGHLPSANLFRVREMAVPKMEHMGYASLYSSLDADARLLRQTGFPESPGRLRSIAPTLSAGCRCYYVAAIAAAFFFDFFSAPATCSLSFFDLRTFFSAASSTS